MNHLLAGVYWRSGWAAAAPWFTFAGIGFLLYAVMHVLHPRIDPKEHARREAARKKKKAARKK